jgi:RNA polymerase subunit RPABC4/transcription elongation factor Spt4
MPACRSCKTDVQKRARFCPRCGRAGPTDRVSGFELLLLVLLSAMAASLLLARQLTLV